MRPRKMNDNLKSFLRYDFLLLFNRYIKENDFEQYYYNNNINVIKQRVSSFFDDINYRGNVKNIQDVMDFEIFYYECGIPTYPNGIFEERNYSLKTNIGKLTYCIAFFIEDIFGITLDMELKKKIVKDIIDIIIK